jgi:hypothetical protein
MALTMIRNKQSGPTVFSDKESGSEVTWEGAGHPDGLDVQPVPEPVLNNVQFQRALTRGVFEVEEADDEIKAILNKHRDSWQAREDQRRKASDEAVERPQDNDTLMVKCIGPAGRGPNPGLCEEPVSVKATKQDQIPPLCPKHVYLKSQFTPEHTDRMIGGRQEVIWRRVRVTDRERELN